MGKHKQADCFSLRERFKKDCSERRDMVQQAREQPSLEERFVIVGAPLKASAETTKLGQPRVSAVFMPRSESRNSKKQFFVA